MAEQTKSEPVSSKKPEKASKLEPLTKKASISLGPSESLETSKSPSPSKKRSTSSDTSESLVTSESSESEKMEPEGTPVASEEKVATTPASSAIATGIKTVAAIALEGAMEIAESAVAATAAVAGAGKGAKKTTTTGATTEEGPKTDAPEVDPHGPFKWDKKPVSCICPHCNQPITTKVRYKMGFGAVLMSVPACVTGFWSQEGGAVDCCRCCFKCGKCQFKCWKKLTSCTAFSFKRTFKICRFFTKHCASSVGRLKRLFKVWRCCFRCYVCMRKCYRVTCKCMCIRPRIRYMQDLVHYCPHCKKALGKQRVPRICC